MFIYSKGVYSLIFVFFHVVSAVTFLLLWRERTFEFRTSGLYTLYRAIQSHFSLLYALSLIFEKNIFLDGRVA